MNISGFTSVAFHTNPAHDIPEALPLRRAMDNNAAELVSDPLYQRIAARWPRAIDALAPKPLIVGATKQIINGLRLTDPEQIAHVEALMDRYTSTVAYLRRVCRDPHRVCLTGKRIGYVTPEQRDRAAARLMRIKRTNNDYCISRFYPRALVAHAVSILFKLGIFRPGFASPAPQKGLPPEYVRFEINGVPCVVHWSTRRKYRQKIAVWFNVMPAFYPLLEEARPEIKGQLAWPKEPEQGYHNLATCYATAEITRFDLMPQEHPQQDSARVRPQVIGAWLKPMRKTTLVELARAIPPCRKSKAFATETVDWYNARIVEKINRKRIATTAYLRARMAERSKENQPLHAQPLTGSVSLQVMQSTFDAMAKGAGMAFDTGRNGEAVKVKAE